MVKNHELENMYLNRLICLHGIGHNRFYCQMGFFVKIEIHRKWLSQMGQFIFMIKKLHWNLLLNGPLSKYYIILVLCSFAFSISYVFSLSFPLLFYIPILHPLQYPNYLLSSSNLHPEIVMVIKNVLFIPIITFIKSHNLLLFFFVEVLYLDASGRIMIDSI